MAESTETRQLSTIAEVLDQQLGKLLILDAEKLAYIAILVLAVLTRFWDLGVRAMSHDECLHVKFSWDLYRGAGYAHTPMMHGPLLFHMTALFYSLFGDNDFTARMYAAIVGVLVVMFPYLLRRWLGKAGALCASVLFLISPFIMYYSRYIRHDLPAILFALVVAWASWRYIEERQNKWLVVLAIGQVLLFASKEVAFIYIAIFGSFLTLYLINCLLEREWQEQHWRIAFIVALVGAMIALTLMGIGLVVQQAPEEELSATETAAPADPFATAEPVEEVEGRAPGRDLVVVALVLFVTSLLIAAGSVLAGQWSSLRDIPVLDVCMVMGTLILPLLSPFVIQWLGFDPMDESDAGLRTSALIAIPVTLVSALIGVLWGMEPPKRTREGVPPTPIDWVNNFLTSRWWVIGGVYWLIFIFLFTTMFTNGTGLATGVVGSLGYWLAQQEVRRGSHPFYHFILVTVPIYEFLPLILSLAGGILGLSRLFRVKPTSLTEEAPSGTPRRFPVLRFTGYWVVLSFIAYSLAGERMPWLTVHITTPMILLGGWALGQLLERVEWRKWQVWLLIALLPMAVIALARVLTPLLSGSLALGGRTQTELAEIGMWLASALVFVGTFIAVVKLTLQSSLGQTLQAGAVGTIAGLVFLTARAAWMGSFVNYDYPTEFMVYAHASGAVTDVMGQIEEISYRTTDGLNLQVAYDNEVTWSFTWYLRDYPDAIYYGDQPSRGVLTDVPVILAGPSHWIEVESILGDRYYRFEYIRMWWPMQDYFNLTQERVVNALTNPQIRRGLWEIFLNRDYTSYGEATGRNFDLAQWSPAERMRVYIRKDIFAQVWHYGVAATEIAEALDPYAEGYRQLMPEETLGVGQLNQPHGIAIGPDGLIYVADSGDHRIAVFDPNGTLIQAIGVGQLNEPWDVAVSNDGYVYVADTWNHRVVQFTLEGELVAQWGRMGFNPEDGDPLDFYGPRGIAVDPNGNVYVADTGNKRILVFDPEGVFLRQIGSPGSMPGQLDEPVGVAVTSDGRVFVADTWNQRIQVFNPDGTYLNGWPLNAWYTQTQTNERPYLEVDANGLVYISDPNASRILVFFENGQYLYSFGDVATISLAGAAIADDEGAILVVDTEAGVIQRYSSNILQEVQQNAAPLVEESD